MRPGLSFRASVLLPCFRVLEAVDQRESISPWQEELSARRGLAEAVDRRGARGVRRGSTPRHIGDTVLFLIITNVENLSFEPCLMGARNAPRQLARQIDEVLEPAQFERAALLIEIGRGVAKLVVVPGVSTLTARCFS